MPPVQKTRDTFVTRSAAKRATSAAAPTPAIPTRKAATTFKSFPRLPPEIQLKIWEFAIKGYDGRIIQVDVKSLLTKYSDHVRGVIYSSTAPIPGMLHACSVAREIALTRYELALSSFASKGPRTYVDYNTDTIYFGEALLQKSQSFALSMLLRDLDDNDIAKIQKLGMAQKLWNYQTFCNLHVLVDFPGLEQVILTWERPSAGKSSVGKSAEFVPVKKNEEFYTCISHHGIMDDPDDLMVWPDEVEEILTDHMEEPYEKQGLLEKMPTLEFKMLRDKAKTRKSPVKGKGKSK